jgi:hypothetical protein
MVLQVGFFIKLICIKKYFRATKVWGGGEWFYYKWSYERLVWVYCKWFVNGVLMSIVWFVPIWWWHPRLFT